MKSIFTAFILSFSSFSFACIDLSGSYTDCRSNLPQFDPDSIIITQDSSDLSLIFKYPQTTSSLELILDGITRTSTIDRNGQSRLMKTTSICNSDFVKVDYEVDLQAEILKTGYHMTKDSRGRLIFTESLNGNVYNVITCRAVR